MLKTFSPFLIFRQNNYNPCMWVTLTSNNLIDICVTLKALIYWWRGETRERKRFLISYNQLTLTEDSKTLNPFTSFCYPITQYERNTNNARVWAAGEKLAYFRQESYQLLSSSGGNEDHKHKPINISDCLLPLTIDCTQLSTFHKLGKREEIYI